MSKWEKAQQGAATIVRNKFDLKWLSLIKNFSCKSKALQQGKKFAPTYADIFISN